MGIKERKEREREQRRGQIIRAGEKLFLKKGLEGATMEDVARACELSKGTLYLYFKSKEELYLAIVLKAMEALYDMMEKGCVKKDDTAEDLRLVGETYLKFYKKHPNYFKLITSFVDHEKFTGKAGVKEVIGKIMAVNERIWALITRIIEEGIRKGRVDRSVKPIELAITLWTASNGMIQFMDHIKNERMNPEDGAFLSFGLDCEGMLRRTWETLISSALSEREGHDRHQRA